MHIYSIYIYIYHTYISSWQPGPLSQNTKNYQAYILRVGLFVDETHFLRSLKLLSVLWAKN